MLVLTRKKGEAILIGDQIELSILEVGNDQIKIGIRAPKEIGILRKELYISVENTNIDAEQFVISSKELHEQYKNLKKNM